MTAKNPKINFFRVPNARKKWCKLMRRELIGPKGTKNVCEGNFGNNKNIVRMTPKPQEYIPLKVNEDGTTSLGERVVISGISGLYPDASNVKQLSEILYNKINPIKKTNRWKYNHPEAAEYSGNIPGLTYFDAQFFKVHYRLGNLMDAMSRKLLEQSYQAIYDAGLSPEHLSGKKVGVYIGTCFSESEKAVFYTSTSKTGLGIAGCNKSMFANRISYWLNAKGPSMSVDNACCSSITALELAYSAISRGDCEAAIVGGAYLCLHPQSSVHYGRIMNLSMDGKTKSFDNNATGCVKSEAVNILFLQKAKNALRIYADMVYVKSEFTSLIESEIGPKYDFCRNPKNFTSFLKIFYNEANISPQAVQYLEAFGSAIPEADKSELEAINDFFCKIRNKPLLVGSVMSNIGYGEAASGISAITKVLLGYYHGKLAANLHYESLREDVPGIKEGRIEILKEHTEFDRTYAAVNSLSITGINAHVLLHGHYKPKDIDRYKTSIPRLVLISGRQESAVKKIIDDLKSRPIDPEEHALLHNIHEARIAGHLGRGFVILDTNDKNETVSHCEVTNYFDQGNRPLWFVYSGMGSQWVGMGRELMRIPLFAAAIERCHRVLEPKGVNIIDIITSDDKKIFDNILNSFVGITAIQIGLTDILHELQIFPDNIIGHSLGEIGCAYADGCFTAEETILCAYSRGLVSIQTPLIRGSMAAVGLGYREISKLCPPGIEVACHNSPESSTISGPAKIMSEFVPSLTSKGIFAKEVPSSNIAFHSRYIADAGPGLLKYMREFITSPKLRSARWVSTSVPQDKWDEPSAKYSSAEYHTNNLLNSVLFEETSKLIPSDAVLIEIAPHGLLQAILKRSLPKSCCLLPMTRREHPDNARHLLEAIGRLFVEGFNPKVKALYPKVEFPVSTETPMLSHLVEWVHTEKWTLPKTFASDRRTAAASKYTISTYDVEHSYLKGHVIRGKNLYPFSAALVSVWDTLAMSLNVKTKSLSVQFQNVFLHSQPALYEQRLLHISVSLHRGTGQFEVLNENSLMVRGFIKSEIVSTNETQRTQTTETNVNAQDIYQLLHAKDFHYIDDFCSIHSVNETLTEAQIEWKNNWVTFIDGILQLNILKRKHNTVSKPNFIRKLVIDVDKQHNSEIFSENGGVTLLNANVLGVDTTICGGVIMEHLKFVDLPVLNEDGVELKTLKFTSFFPNEVTNKTSALYIFLQIVADNVNKKELNILEIVNNDTTVSEFRNIESVINNTPGVKARYSKINISDKCCDSLISADLILVSKLSTDTKLYQTLNRVLKHDSFFINKETSGISSPDRSSSYHVVSGHNIGDAKMELAIWRPTKRNPLKMLSIRSPRDLSANSSVESSGGEYYLPLEDEIDPEFGGALKIAVIGDLNSLYWVKATQNNSLGVDVKVHYAGVNIVYVNKLLGTKLNRDNDRNKSVSDFSGITKSGVRVMGVVQNDTISSRLKANSELLWPVPAHWTLEDAATVPLPYSQAFYILFIKAQITVNSTICVQGGAGALGQAIISIALAHNCEIFTTVSSNAKKQFLKKLFPQLKGDHIVNSRDINSVDIILSATKGKGCDIVILSCMKGDLKNSFLQCCGFNGITVDTTLIQNNEGCNLGMSNLTEERGYLLGDFSSIFQQIDKKDANHLQALIIEGIRRGYVRPLSRVTFEPQDVSRAFRLQASCYNRGRVLLDLRQHAMNILPRVTCSFSSWQLLISDNEILTLKLAERLVKLGAKKVLLLLNNPSKCVDIQSRLWNEDGVEVKVKNKNIWNDTEVSNVIQNCNKDGSLESVFIVISNEKSKNVNETIENFSAIIQKSCASLRYFALVSTGNVTNEQTSLFGASGLNQIITNIKLPDVKVMHNEQIASKNNVISINNAIDILERAVCSKNSTILAHMCPTQGKSMLEQLLKLADIKKEKAHLDLTLKELNVDDFKAIAIQGYLSDVYDVCLKVEDIQLLSIKAIVQLEKEHMRYNFEDRHGIGSFIFGVDTDELLSTTDVVFLPTLSSPSLRDDEIDVSQTHLCIVPGVEGHHSRFSEFCERLKLPALVLQPGLDHTNETVPEMAKRFVQILLNKVQLKKNFYLLGYESGVLVALEMAAILEESGVTGTVFCIGGSPTEIIAHFQSNLSDYKTSQQLQEAVLKHMYSLMTNEDPDILDKLCKNLSWHEKINACMDSLLGKVPHSIQYAKQCIEMAYTRLASLLQFRPEPKLLESQIISLRPRYSTSNIDLSLQNYSHQKIISYQLQAPLSCATQDLMCTAIINQHLSSDILEIYNKRNICETYHLNTELQLTVDNELNMN